MKYKLICIDMDGTLLNSKHEISEFNKEMIKKAMEKGIVVAITTGRLYMSALVHSELLGIETYVISSNGCYIKNIKSDEVIYESTLTKEQYYRIKEIGEKHKLNRLYYNTFDTVISGVKFPEDYAYKVSNEILPEEKRIKFLEEVNLDEIYDEYDGKILKSIFIEEEYIDRLSKAKEELRTFEDLEVVSSWPNNVEIMPAGTSKGEAVKRLAEILKIKPEEVICMGDSENDLSMIKYAGLGIAMGNAIDLIKENANYITDTNENSGVGKAIEKFIFSNS
ncbi:Cof-type HAD-IIB family hydrolase [Clostridium massiliamazoniense]|uniref:Cof-type HAD-IIB family hydrolase n=1 Tax=Clostridium massiliamazoniense TaxID=1347366 RepID=UPI0006D7CFC8|nr:Cof-type HAD-IIB family hydrolase [Clostridium massiliamazoniense]